MLFTVPRGLPKIYVDALSPTTVRVEWDALPRGVAQGVVTKHKVEWCLLNHPSTHVDTVPGHVYRYTISGNKYSKMRQCSSNFPVHTITYRFQDCLQF